MTYLRKLHPKSLLGQRLTFSNGPKNVALTVEGCSDPMQDCAPEVHPTDELEIVGRIRLALNDVEYRLVQHRNGTGYACDAEGLGSKDRENESGHERR